MKASELVSRMVDLSKRRTLYVNGGWGWPLTETNKARALTKSYNTQPERKRKIMAASADTIAVDCVCSIKMLFWGWTGDLQDHNGGAKYATGGMPDINADQMMARCPARRTDWQNIQPGAVVWKTGHIGVYIGDGLVVESTPIWKDGCQITALNAPRTGYHYRKWTCWGLLPWVEYEPEEEEMTFEKFKEYMARYEEETRAKPADAYAEEALAWAKANGISVGDTAGNLMPQSFVKRQDVALMLYRAETKNGK